MSLYKRTFKLVTPYWKQLVIASGSASISAIISGLLFWMIGPLLETMFQLGSNSDLPGATTDLSAAVSREKLQPVVDNTFVADIMAWIDSLRDGMKDWVDSLVLADTMEQTFINFCIVIMVVVVAKNIFIYVQAFFMAFVQQSVIRSLRNNLFAKYERLTLSYFHSRPTGEVMSRVTNDVVVLNDSINIGFNHLVSDFVMSLTLFSFLIILSIKLTLLAMIILPAVFGFIWFVGRKMRKYSERSQARMADVNSVLEEAISNMRIVKAFSMEPFELNKFAKATGSYFNALLRMIRIRAFASPINDMLATIAGVVILLYAGSEIASGKGELDAGDFMTFIFVMFALIKPVKSLSNIHIKLQEGLAASERIFEVLDTDERIADRPNAKKIENFKTKLSYNDICFSYKAGETVLDKVSFEVKPGEVIAVVGPSGAGKSTLFDLVPRFIEPQSGSILIDGHDIRDLTLSSLRNLMGIVTQETLLFNDTIMNNIAYGMEDVSPDLVAEAAKMANAHNFIIEFEDGYQTEVGNRGVMLSGGQRQRLAIARALLKDPEILIFDEATSALDTESEVLVQSAINNLMANRTTLVIAHRLSTIKNADRIMVLERGKIIEAGKHEELLELGGLYSRLYAMQFRED